MKGKKAFLRAYGPVMAVADSVAGLPAGVPVNRVWTEVYGGRDWHNLSAGVWRVDALRYIVTLRPWAADWDRTTMGNVDAWPRVQLGAEIPVWAYPGIAADTVAAISAEGPVRINGHGDLPG